jgi:FecR protein
MGNLYRRGAVAIAAGIVGATLAWSSLAQAQSEPPGRVGRLAFTNGTVSFHDDQQSEWTPAVVNTPLSTGDSLWTEPNARSEVSLAGTRIRMAGATQLDMLAVDDTQTRLQIDQGRIDVKTAAMDTNQPYQITTPRGTISLQQQGDYYVEAGSTQDPTRLGVRAGAAQIQSLNGQVLAVRAGEVGEVTGDAATPQLRTIQSAPPPQPAAWADRDRQVVYDQPPQYLSSGVTGYEDLNQYGTWINDGSYGEVWVPRSVPSGWAPYRTGHWAYVQPWGWTWIDDQPWGFAPYHYGRWANNGGRWMWVPPQREARPVYAPALVAFVGGVELAATLSRQSSAPVGWFPLGPREAYVPSYTTNRDYYQRINRPAQVQDQVLNERWQRAERHDPAALQNPQQAALMNQRFATVVPATTFVRSQPVMRAALQVAPAKLAAAPVAPVAAPPAPTASVAAVKAETPANAARPAATPAPATPAPATNIPTAKTAVADMPTFARPTALQAPAAPGPKFAATRPTAPTADTAKPAAPALAPRQGAAPPELKGAVTPAPTQPAKPGEPPRQQQAAPQPQAAPAAGPRPEPPKQAEPPKPPQAAPQQAAPQPHAAPQAAPAPQPQAVPHPAPAPAPQQQAKPEPPRPQPQPQPQQAAPPPPQHPQPQQAAPQPPQHPQPQPQAPRPPDQAQAPHPAPPPPQAQPAPQPQAHPAPPAPAPQQKNEEKK